MAALPGTKRGPRKLLDEDGSCPDCGVPGGHPEYEVAGLPRCPDNWTLAHLEKVEARAQRAWDAYEAVYDSEDPEASEAEYSTYRHRAEDAEAAAMALYSDVGSTIFHWL